MAVNRIYPREIVHLKRALNAIEPIKTACMGEAKLLPSDSNKSLASIALQKIAEQLNPCHLIWDRIGKEIKPDPSAMLSKGNVIAEGVDAELDELRKMAYSGKDYLLQMQQREIKNTGISSLKIAYNNVFGYYIEVTHTHKDKVPAEWTRKQTLVNAERYITDELKEYEEKILALKRKYYPLKQDYSMSLCSALRIIFSLYSLMLH